MNPKPVTWLVLNPSSGSYDDRAVGQLVAGLEAAGYPATTTVRVPDDPLPDRAALERGNADLLVIFTGDGTANRALTCLYGWQGKILVLPGGTQNLLSRALHGECSMVRSVAMLNLGRLREVRRSLIRCSAGDALVEIVAGPGAAWSDVRESLREGDVGELAASAREAIAQTVGGDLVTLVEPAAGRPDGYQALRVCPSADGLLTIDGYAAETMLDYARQGVALLRRDFREGPHDELGHHRAVTCRSPEPIALMLDGERATGQCEETIEVLDCDLTFLACGDNADG